jgi:hypothetical protein
LGGALMFGYAAFAQSPFAALGNSAYADSVIEAMILADSNIGVRGVVTDITEAIIAFIDSERSATVNFQGVALEAITVADSSTRIYGTLAEITENVTFADSENAIKGMFDTVVEPTTMLDFASYIGWFIINDNQTITWSAANNSQTVTWQNIGNDQTPNWVVINNTQA